VRSRAALLVAPLLLLSLLPGAVSAAPPTDARAAHRAAVLAYWTPARVRSAIPRDFTFDAVRGFQPAAKPGTGGGTTGTTSGASWAGSDAVFKGTGKVLFTMGTSNYVCSGSVVNEGKGDRSVILTAGHCVVENNGRFASKWLFVPDYDEFGTFTCANTRFGCWVADELYAHTSFATSGSFNNTAVQYDWGFAVVGADGKAGLQLDTAVGGAFDLVIGGASSGETLTALGYPAAQKYNGQDLVYCRNAIGTDPSTSGTTWSMPCGMTGGSSGGPWGEVPANTEPGSYTFANMDLVSLNSYGYSGVKNMYGPKFNGNTSATLSDAINGTLGSATVRATLP
jgi:hypothetical protein